MILKMKIKNLLLFILCYTISLGNDFGAPLYGQNSGIDSLLNLLKKDSIIFSKHSGAINEKNDKNEPDTNKIIHLIALCNEYTKAKDYKSGLKYGIKALQITTSFVNSEQFKQTGNNPEKLWNADIAHNQTYLAAQKCNASAYNNIGNIYYNQGNYKYALKNYIASLHINEKLKNKKDIAGSFLNIGIIYYYQNNYPEALNNYYTALNIRKEIGDQEGIANSYTNIGLVFDDPVNYAEALKNFFAALKIYEEIDNKTGVAASYNNIGHIYYNQDNYHDALKMYTASKQINETMGDRYGVAFSYNAIGNIYWNQVNYPNVQLIKKTSFTEKPGETAVLRNLALKNYEAALKIRENVGDKEEIIESYINIGTVQMELKKINSAQDYLNKALQLSKEIKSKEWIQESYGRLEELDSTQGNWKASYQHYKQYILYSDSVNIEQAEKKLLQDKMNNDFEKNEASFTIELDKKNAVTTAESKKQNIINILVIVVLALIIAFAGFVARSRKSQQK